VQWIEVQAVLRKFSAKKFARYEVPLPNITQQKWIRN